MTNNEYLQQQYREDMRSRNLISFNDWVAQRNPQPQRTWVGLTDEEVDKLVDDEDWYNDPHGFAIIIEAALRSKNT